MRNRKFFVGALPSNLRKKELKALLSKFGTIKQLQIITKSGTKKCKGFAFVTFANGMNFVDLTRRKVNFKGRDLVIKEQLRGKELIDYQAEFQKRRIFVNHLPKFMKDQDLQRIFSKFGKIESSFCVKDQKTGNAAPYGYILFKDPQSVDFALKEPIYFQNYPIIVQRFIRKNGGKQRRPKGLKKRQKEEKNSRVLKHVKKKDPSTSQNMNKPKWGYLSPLNPEQLGERWQANQTVGYIHFDRSKLNWTLKKTPFHIGIDIEENHLAHNLRFRRGGK